MMRAIQYSVKLLKSSS